MPGSRGIVNASQQGRSQSCTVMFVISMVLGSKWTQEDHLRSDSRKRWRRPGHDAPELLLASLGTCAGYYALQYLRTRLLPTDGLTVQISAEKETSGGCHVLANLFHRRL